MSVAQPLRSATLAGSDLLINARASTGLRRAGSCTPWSLAHPTSPATKDVVRQTSQARWRGAQPRKTEIKPMDRNRTFFDLVYTKDVRARERVSAPAQSSTPPANASRYAHEMRGLQQEHDKQTRRPL